MKGFYNTSTSTKLERAEEGENGVKFSLVYTMKNEDKVETKRKDVIRMLKEKVVRGGIDDVAGERLTSCDSASSEVAFAEDVKVTYFFKAKGSGHLEIEGDVSGEEDGGEEEEGGEEGGEEGEEVRGRGRGRRAGM